MKKQRIKLHESQVAVLREMLAAQDNFLQEAAGFNKMIQEGKGDTLLTEGLADSFQKLMQKGGFNALKRAVQAAVVAGSLMGVSDGALAQAATKAGASPQQAQELAMVTKSAGGGSQSAVNPKTTQFAKELTKLNQRYVVADGTQNKVFMKFTGNINDVVGIEPKNGYPIFAKGSESEAKLQQAFKDAKTVTGVVNVRGKDFPGTFIENDGLWYTIQSSGAQGGAEVQAADPAPATQPASAQGQSNKGPELQNSEIIDFTGLWQGAMQFYQEKKGGDGSIKFNGKSFADRNAFVAEFFRANDFGFKDMQDEEIFKMFDNGLKAKVEKGKFKMGGVTRAAMPRR